MVADKEHWVFDLDGTLTEAVHDFDFIRSTLGVPVELGILEWLATLPASERTHHEQWLDEHPDAVMVAIDTLGKVRPGGDGRRNAYEVDVQALSALQDLFRTLLHELMTAKTRVHEIDLPGLDA